MLSSSTVDDLVREQENLRLQSLRHLEELRIRQSKYRSCRFLRQPNQSDVIVGAGSGNKSFGERMLHGGERQTLVDGDKLYYRPVSTVVKSCSSQGFDPSLNTNNGSAASHISRLADSDRKRITASHSISTVLSDDICSETWSTSATRAARKKLISGQSHAKRNVNNSSSGCSENKSRAFEPLSTSSEFADMNGFKAPDIDMDSAGYFSSGDAGKLNSYGTPQKSDQSLEGTPKSILRHRQIIDKNVHVETKFNHTPTTHVRNRRHQRGLNFSYSDVDDAQLFGRKMKSVNFDVDSKKSTSALNSQAVDLSSQPNESRNETQAKSLTSSLLPGDTLQSSERFYYALNAANSSDESVIALDSATARQTASDGLLLQIGNDRQNAKIVQQIDSRQPSDLFSRDPLMTNSATVSTSQYQVVIHCIHPL